MHYLITGGTGFIGSHLISFLLKEDHTITILSRKPSSQFQNTFFDHPSISFISRLNTIKDDEKIDFIINLAGHPIDCRWTKSNKEKIINSRLTITQALIDLCDRLKSKPSCFISASAVGYYGNKHMQVIDEHTTPEDSFTHKLCAAWEKIAFKAENYGIRTCVTRFGVIFGPDGGYVKKISLPFKMGLGGTLGSGETLFSWVHIQDVVKAIYFLVLTSSCKGAYNITAPHRTTQKEVVQAFSKALHRPCILKIPSAIIGFVFGEMGQALLLQGNYVQPMRLTQAGYIFYFKDLHTAFHTIVSTQKI